MNTKLAVLFALILPLSVQAKGLPNPGFEDGPSGWAINDTMSKVIPDAAHEGKMGLRITDDNTSAGSSVTSAKLPVQPGQEITLTYWSKAQSDCAGVYFWFYDSAGKVINDPAQRAGAGHPVCGVKKGDGGMSTLKAVAPGGAVAVAVWIHSFGSATGTVDFDDFTLTGIADDAVPVMAEVKPQKAVAPAGAPANLPPRTKPPVIIIKVDDLRQIDGKVNSLWDQFANFIKSRQIKAGIGIICETLQNATPEYVKWIKDRQATGLFEFWFHGWDHATHLENGVAFNEFNKRPFEDQKKRFDDSQALAMDKLGFPFATFGPGGGTSNGSFDENTIRVMAEDPHMKVWLYPQPIDAVGKKLDAGGKVAILDRVWEVNTESKVGLPDFEKFVEGYARHPEREYFVLQGHPMQWTPDRFQNFVKIIDFLTAQNAVFMTPSEFAAMKAKSQ